jgi:hypothetical protein
VQIANLGKSPAPRGGQEDETDLRIPSAPASDQRNWRKIMKKYYMVSLWSMLSVALLLSQVSAFEITADMITREGKITRNGKLYLKDNKCRVEKGSTPVYTIVRGDKGLVWQINGAENTYVEAKLTPELKPWIEERLFGEVGRKEIGTETMGGHPTKKYEVAVKQGNKQDTYHQWFATDIRLSVKIANVNGRWSVEYRNFKNGAPENLFNLPAGASLDTMTVPDVLGGH